MRDIFAGLREGSIDIVEHTRKCLDEAKRLNEEYHHLTVLSEERALAQAERLKKSFEKSKDKPLFGYLVSAKDAICVKGVETTAGSRILKGYKPLFDATVIRRVEEAGGIILGKTAQDEFGFGTFGVNVGLDHPIPLNPIDKQRSCGGSSSGAGGLARIAPFPHISLGESTGGSIANPASFCGVYGLTPTYGRVSRHGLIDYGNSLDKIGTLGNDLPDAGKLLRVISGHDPKDSTSLTLEALKEEGGGDVKGLKMGVIKESFGSGVDDAVAETVRKGISALENGGASVEEVSLEFPLKYSLAAYYVLAMSEASTNLAKYCGMRYGQSAELKGSFNDYFSSVRESHFTREAKRRIIMGTFARMSGHRDAFYLKAASVRTRIIKAYKEAFKRFDVLVSPTTPVVAPRFDEIEKLTPLQHYQMDQLLVGPNLAGLPHLSVPIGEATGMPVGMLLIGDHLKEETLMRAGNALGDKT